MADNPDSKKTQISDSKETDQKSPTGKQTQTEGAWSRMTPTPPDHPIFKAGAIVGGSYSGNPSRETKVSPDPTTAKEEVADKVGDKPEK